MLAHHRKVYGLAPEHAAVQVSTPMTAPAPPRALDKSPASAGLLAWMLVQKYRHHLPLYRQEEIFAREGLQIPRQTQCDWVLACAEQLAPIQAALRRKLLDSRLPQIDDTPVQCQHGRGGHKTQAYLWVLLSPLVDGVVYDFTPGRGYDDVEALVGEIQGVLVGDGYAVHGKLADASRGTLVTAGCWSHVLRKFREAIAESPRAAAAMVVSIAALFAVEKEADELLLGPAERLALRTARGPALLAEIDGQRRALLGTTSASGPLAAPLTYLTNQWPSLVRFLDDGRIPIHNNGAHAARGMSTVVPRPRLCRLGAGRCGERRGIPDAGRIRSRHGQRLLRNASRRSFGRKRTGRAPEASACWRARSFNRMSAWR